MASQEYSVLELDDFGPPTENRQGYGGRGDAMATSSLPLPTGAVHKPTVTLEYAVLTDDDVERPPKDRT
ncbi:hypothetical protein MBLNU230_g2477t1 [Neophaeotheca triangularis]